MLLTFNYFTATNWVLCDIRVIEDQGDQRDTMVEVVKKVLLDLQANLEQMENLAQLETKDLPVLQDHLVFLDKLALVELLGQKDLLVYLEILSVS